MIRLIKFVHTVIWLVFVSAIFYVLYAGVTNTVNIMLWVSIGLVFFEAIVLFVNKWTCPLTPLARKYSDDESDNFDIYLPSWLAKYNKLIFTSLFVLGLLLVIFNFFKS